MARTHPGAPPDGVGPVPGGGPGLPLGTGRVERSALGRFALEAGPVLELELAHRHDGPGPGAPQVLVIHALTGSADATGDWWAPTVGPRRALDTGAVGVLCANLLGSRYGSTGPASTDPATGEPWGARFPQPTARDQARALWRLADALGIERFALVTGGSLGGMVALEVALERPDRVGHVVPIGAPGATGPLAIAWNHLQLELVERLGSDGLGLARQLAMTTYRSEADFATRFGRERQDDGRFAVVSYLEHQGRKLGERFDPVTYAVLVRVMDGHDIGRDRGGTVAALRALASHGAALTGIGIEGDILYGPDQVRALVADAAAAGVEAGYRELATRKGHDGFLVEWEQLDALLRDALALGVARSGRRP